MFMNAICEDVRRMPSMKDRFLYLKHEKSVTLEEIAKAIKTNKSSLSQFVNGRLNIRAEMITDLANYFDVDQAYLLGESEIRRKNSEDIINNAYFRLAKSCKDKNISLEKLQRIIDAL